MKNGKIIRTAAFAAAMGLGIWGVAVSFTAFNFADGDTLSAAELNTLLNTNFESAEVAINDLESAVTDLEADKFDRAGGGISGRTDITGDAVSSGGNTTLLRVAASEATGSAAMFQSNTDGNTGTINVKQLGASPAVSIKNGGGGPLISGVGAATLNFVVDNNGTIRIGNMGPDGTEDPMLTLDAESGKITNSVGSGLPLAFGTVVASGSLTSGTSNFSVSKANIATGVRYEINIPGEFYIYENYTTLVTVTVPNNVIARTTSGGGRLLVYLHPVGGGNSVEGTFNFVTYKAGN